MEDPEFPSLHIGETYSFQNIHRIIPRTQKKLLKGKVMSTQAGPEPRAQRLKRNLKSIWEWLVRNVRQAAAKALQAAEEMPVDGKSRKYLPGMKNGDLTTKIDQTAIDQTEKVLEDKVATAERDSDQALLAVEIEHIQRWLARTAADGGSIDREITQLKGWLSGKTGQGGGTQEDEEQETAARDDDVEAHWQERIKQLRPKPKTSKETNAANQAEARKNEAEGEQPKPPSDELNLTGLALSGGGIRSATFSLGALQALCRHGALNRIDYLSTVSGGGYIGTGLTWWLSRRSDDSGEPYIHGLTEDRFPYGTKDPKDPEVPKPNEILSHLREHGNYLTPGGGISFLSGAAILMRAVLLNLLVWIPVVTLVMLLLFWAGPRADDPPPDNPSAVVKLLHGLMPNGTKSDEPAKAKPGEPAKPKSDEPDETRSKAPRPYAFAVLTVLGALLALVFVFGSINYSFSAWAFSDVTGEKDPAPPYPDVYAIDSPWRRAWETGLVVVVALAVIAVLGIWLLHILEPVLDSSAGSAGSETGLSLFDRLCFVIAVVLFLFVLFHAGQRLLWIWRVNGLPTAYGGRRFYERVFGWLLLFALIFVAIGTLPLVYAEIEPAIAGSGGVAGVALGALSGVWGFMRSTSKEPGLLGPGLVLPLGSILLFYGLALVAFGLALGYFDGPSWIKPTLMGTILIAVLSMIFANINFISPHRFYRDRLMEAFMPDRERIELPTAGAAKRANELALCEAWNADEPNGPFPIINTNLIITDGKSGSRKLVTRGGDNFILTPFRCGSGATGWELTKTFVAGDMTLASAMTISGAAANPGAGVGGKGLTRNRFVSAAMTLLNLRLGLWVRKPSDQTMIQVHPNHLHPGATFLIPGRGHHENRKFLELSDGGHFENLGIYELIRRGCKLIIVCDGGQDVAASYGDFVTAIRRIEQDFGAEIAFTQAGGPERMVTTERCGQYPKDAEYADHGYFLAEIHYHRTDRRRGPRKGYLIYLKTTMIQQLSMKAKGYKGAQPDFPDQSTGDQFFDEEQFEAYRELGYRIADRMAEEVQLKEFVQRIKA